MSSLTLLGSGMLVLRVLVAPLPELTVMSTVEPLEISEPSLGDRLMTVSTGKVLVSSRLTLPTTRPAFSSLTDTLAKVSPTRPSGTVTISSAGPVLTRRVTVLPESTIVPGSGLVEMTRPSSTSSSATFSTWL